MSKKDAVTKDYMGNSTIFADAFNFLIYDGQPVINSKQLRAMDTAELVLPYGKDGARTSVQRYRDELKYLTAMEDGNAAYMVLGIETQSEPHYAMPVRDMLYDAMQYARQVKEAASSHREEAKKQRSMAGPGEIGEKKSSESRESLDSGEFLGGFYRNDRLLPVITLVILFSPDPWDGPMSIYEMLADVDERFLPFVQDYRINLITPAALDEESINRFRTSLREVMLYIKYSRDKDQLRNILETHPRFLALDREAAEVINTVTNSKIKFEEKEGKVDMCVAIKQMCQESWDEGLRKGEEIGEKRGEKRGIEQGISLINKLNSFLINTNRLDDLTRAANDLEYQAKLMEELLPGGR